MRETAANNRFNEYMGRIDILMEKQPNLAHVNCVGALCYVLGMGELSWNTEYVTHPERLLKNFEEVQENGLLAGDISSIFTSFSDSGTTRHESLAHIGMVISVNPNTVFYKASHREYQIQTLKQFKGVFLESSDDFWIRYYRVK